MLFFLVMLGVALSRSKNFKGKSNSNFLPSVNCLKSVGERL